MFGFLWGLFTLGAVGVDKYNRVSQDEENRERARKNGDLTYYGSRGNEYLTENGRWVWTKIDHNTGNEVIADMKTGQIYYNLTEMRKKEHINRMANREKTVRFSVSGERIPTYYGKYKRLWGLIDIETNVPVQIISVNCVSFYQELNHGMILRPADGETMKNIVGNHTVKDLIELFNKRQREMQGELEIHKDDSFWIDRNYFFTLHHDIYIDNNNQFNVFFTGYSEGNKARWKYIKADNKKENK